MRNAKRRGHTFCILNSACCITPSSYRPDHLTRIPPFTSRGDPIEVTAIILTALILSFLATLYPAYKANVGIVLQSYLYRTFSDVERANQLKCRVRLCKGAYKEPSSVAFPEKSDVDANYVKCMLALLERGNYPGIATHDVRLISSATECQKACDSSAR